MAADHFTTCIKVSKINPYRSTCTIPVAATHTTTCPVRAMKTFLHKSQHSSSFPLFTLHTGEFLTRQHLTQLLRRLLEATGLTPEQATHYNSHSLRLGAATMPPHLGFPAGSINPQAGGRAQHASVTSTPRQRHCCKWRKSDE